MLWHGKNFRGILTKAKEMIFNNTGTNLISTNAEDAIKEVNNKLSWTQIGSTYTWSDTYGNTPITIPSNAKEVLVSGEYTSSTLINTIIFPITFSSGTRELTNGMYKASNDYMSWTITVTQGAIGLRAVEYNGSNIGTNVTAKVYYR